MIYVVVKWLKQSELGWFEACREQGRETGRQRALNIDVEVLREIFPDAKDLIELSIRNRSTDSTTTRPLRLQHKNWRLAGPVVGGDRYASVQANDIVLLVFDSGDASGPPTNLTWAVLSQNDARTSSLFNMARRRLVEDSCAIVPDDERDMMLRIARRRLEAFGGDLDADTAGLGDHEWEKSIEWLETWGSERTLLALVREGTSEDTRRVLASMGKAVDRPKETLPEKVLRLYGADLLADKDRRERLTTCRFGRARSEVPSVGRWVPGGTKSLQFVDAMGLPSCMAGSPVSHPEDFEDIDAFPPLGDLHEYQVQLADGIRQLLAATSWKDRRSIVWLPTGTGKTRVTVETLLMECVLDAPRNCILWIADRAELCEQAVESFRHVWMVKGRESRSCRNGVVPSLRVIRLWGGREWQEPPTHPTVIVASIQTLAARLKDDEAFQEELAILGERAAAVVFDEAHHVVAASYTQVIEALGLGRRKNYYGRNQTTGAPLIGLTATPIRTNDDETERLVAKFTGGLIEPRDPYRSLQGFQDDGFLSKVEVEVVRTRYRLQLTQKERGEFEIFHSLPARVLERAGEDTERTVKIIRDLDRRLHQFQSVLVFACSVEHCRTIASALARLGHQVASLDGSTPRPVRWRTIERFKRREIKVLVNCELLATGFDAPGIDAVVLARPAESRILYAQMVGRGLRGPKNGGTETCRVLDFQDDSRDFDLESIREDCRAQFLSAGRGRRVADDISPMGSRSPGLQDDFSPPAAVRPPRKGKARMMLSIEEKQEWLRNFMEERGIGE